MPTPTPAKEVAVNPDAVSRTPPDQSAAAAQRIGELTRSLAEMRAKADQAATEVARVQSELRRLGDERSRLERANAVAGQFITTLRQQLAETTVDHQRQVQRMHATISWRVTAPLRALRRFASDRRFRASGQTAATTAYDQPAETPAPAAGHASWMSTSPTTTPDVSLLLLAGRDTTVALEALKRLQNDDPAGVIEVLLWPAQGNPASLPNGLRLIETAATEVEAISVAVKMARGAFLAVVRDSVVPQRGWLAALRGSFIQRERLALVGARVLDGSGRVVAAGLAINPWLELEPVGSGAAPDHPDVASLRSVDTCAPECFMISITAWRELGGLDLAFARSDCAVCDFAIRARAKGYDTACQPFANVAAPDYGVSDDWSAAQDRWTLRTRWWPQLSSAGPLRAPVRPRALFIDRLTPTPDRDSGSGDIYWFMCITVSMGYDVSFVAAEDLAYSGSYTDTLRYRGITCICTPYAESIDDFLQHEKRSFDLVVLHRGPIAVHLIEPVRHHSPAAKVILDTVDLHFMRQEQEALLVCSPTGLDDAGRTRIAELRAIESADCAVVRSSDEQDLLATLVPKAMVRVMPIMRAIPGCLAPFEPRRDIVFIGGFNHQPNVDAIMTFVRDIWPRIHQVLQAQLDVIGSNPPAELRAMDGAAGIAVRGHVPDLEPVMRGCRLTIAPLRYGAGIKGKVVTSLSYGVPCVATPAAIEGMGLQDGIHVCVAASPEDFAAAVIKLYTDREAWCRLSTAGLAFAADNFSLQTGNRRIATLLHALGLPTTPDHLGGDAK